jgi:hypothetical protein
MEPAEHAGAHDPPEHFPEAQPEVLLLSTRSSQTGCPTLDLHTEVATWHEAAWHDPGLQAWAQPPLLQMLLAPQVFRESSAPLSRHSAWLVGLAQNVFPALQGPRFWVQFSPALHAVTQVPFEQALPDPH